MNQAILLNDDLTFDGQDWQLTGLYSGQLLNIRIKTTQQTYSESLKFDIEIAIEDWLEDNEPESSSEIVIFLD